MSQGGVNKLIVLGHVGSDAELKFTAGGKPVTNFSVAVNESFKNSNGDNVDRAEWFHCVAWNGLAFYRRTRERSIRSNLHSGNAYVLRALN
jgi:single stranded DNA-binding protein